MVVKVLIGNKNLIDTVIMVPWNSSILRVFQVYGVPIIEDRKVVWEHIKRKARSCDGPLLCVGDFNDVVCEMENEREKKGKEKMDSF